MLKGFFLCLLKGFWKGLGNIVAVVAVLIGLWQFGITQQLAQENIAADREVKAVELYVKYSEMQHEVSGRAKEQKRDIYEWERDGLIAITEALYHLVGDDQKWLNTIGRMIKDQEDYIRKHATPDTFSEGFKALIEQVIEFQ